MRSDLMKERVEDIMDWMIYNVASFKSNYQRYEANFKSGHFKIVTIEATKIAVEYAMKVPGFYGVWGANKAGEVEMAFQLKTQI